MNVKETAVEAPKSGHLKEIDGKVPPERIASARTVLQGIIDDLIAIRSKYSELEGWNVQAPESTLTNFGFDFGHNYTAGPGRITSDNFAQHGCYLGAWVRFESSPEEFFTPPTYSFQNLRMSAMTWVYSGNTVSPGFQSEVSGIFKKWFTKLQALDAATVPAQPDDSKRPVQK